MEGLLVDTYKTYKAREYKFLSWLSKAAGEQDARPSINQIAIAAKTLINKGINIPDDVLLALEEDVRGRKEQSVIYRHQKPTADAKASEGHAHFLKVLEDTLAILRGSKIESTHRRTSRTPLETQNNIKNIYEHLEKVDERVTDASEHFEDKDNTSDKENTQDTTPRQAKNAQVKKVKFGKRKGKPSRPLKSSAPDASANERGNQMTTRRWILPTDFAEYDFDFRGDAHFIIYCFFCDFNKIREYVQERWCDYQDGLLSLAAVAITTNAAYDLLRRGEKLLQSHIPEEHGNYGFMAKMLYYNHGLAHVDYDATKDHDDERCEKSNYEEMDFICLPRYRDLSQWLTEAPRNSMAILPHLVDKSLDWNIDFQAQHSKDKWQRDKRILYEMLAECAYFKSLQQAEPNFTIPGEDAFTVGIITMLATRKIPVWLVFASQIHCDIRYILEDNVVGCHDELITTGKRHLAALEGHSTFLANFRLPKLLEAPLETAIQDVKSWIRNDFAGYNRMMALKQRGVRESDVENCYYLRRHPLLCGMVIFRFTLTMHDLSLKLSNAYGSVTGAAHIYNALHHEAPGHPLKWKEMDDFIFARKSQRVFYHEIEPSNPIQYSRSYERVTKISDTMYRRRTNTNQSSADDQAMVYEKTNGKSGILMASEICKQYWHRYCHDLSSKSLPRAHYSYRQLMPPWDEDELVESMMDDVAVGKIRKAWCRTGPPENLPWSCNSFMLDTLAMEASGRSTEEREMYLGRYFKSGKLTSIQILDALCDKVKREGPLLDFDGFEFHQQCSIFLMATYNQFKEDIEKLDDVAGGLDFSKPGDLSIIPHCVFKMMEDDSERAGVINGLKKTMRDQAAAEGEASEIMGDLLGDMQERGLAPHEVHVQLNVAGLYNIEV